MAARDIVKDTSKAAARQIGKSLVDIIRRPSRCQQAASWQLQRVVYYRFGQRIRFLASTFGSVLRADPLFGVADAARAMQ